LDRRKFLQTALPAAALLPGAATLVSGAAALTFPRGAVAAGSKGVVETAVSTRDAELTVTEVTDKIHLISGGGGNVTVFNSPDGVVLVDGGAPEYSERVLKQVSRLTGSTRVHTLFNTHWHWDQTGSNRALGPHGTRIISHENTKLWLGTDVDEKWQHRVYKALPREARPNQTLYTTTTLSIGGETIEYGYLPQAHTDGDIYVLFLNANVLIAGDVVSVGSYPILDYCTNGWIGGMVNAAETLLRLCNPQTRVIPGLGAVQDRAQLQAEHEMLIDMKLKLSKLLAQGMSIKDMLAAKPTAKYDAVWGDPTLFISNAWPGLVQRARELGVAIV
jgi:glyoxylase-like metal-dependent hydrolase (beta-lactamase superfamily II)